MYDKRDTRPDIVLTESFDDDRNLKNFVIKVIKLFDV